MDETYVGHGVRFRYPHHWELGEQRDEGMTSITVSSPETAFWTLSIFVGGPRPQALIDSTLESLREEYNEVDVYRAEGRVADRPNVAIDVDFVCLDLISSASLRAFETDRFSALVVYQGLDTELESARPILEGISESLQID